MINVLHINSYYIGTKLHRIMINHLDLLDIRNQVFVPTSRSGYGYSDIHDNLVISKCFSQWDRLFYKHKQKKIYNSLLKNIDVTSFDVIHAYTIFADGYSAYKLNMKFGKKYVVAVRDTDLNVFFKYFVHLRSLGIEILRNASVIFFLSKPYLEQLLYKYIPAELHDKIRRKSLIVPNGIDDFWHENEFFGNKKLSHGDQVNLLCVGRINQRKNIISIQRACKILQDKGINAKLTVVGPIEDEFIYKKMIQNKDTIYYKPMPKEELIDIYKKNDIFVLPSFTETFGLVYAEALSQGLPIVYSKGQGFDEQFPNGFVGYSVNPKSVESIADGIDKVVRNYYEITNRTVNCSKVFSWNDICEKYEKIYLEILDD